MSLASVVLPIPDGPEIKNALGQLILGVSTKYEITSSFPLKSSNFLGLYFKSKIITPHTFYPIYLLTL